MKLTGQLLLSGEARRVELAPGSVDIEGGRIVAVTRGDDSQPHRLICPGFIDAHLHLPQFRCIGLHGRPLLEWLRTAIFPAETAWANVEQAAADCDAALMQLLSHGTTGFAGYATSHPSATDVALAQCAARNMRCHVGQMLMDQQGPDALLAPWAQVEAAVRAQLRAWPRMNANAAPCRQSASINPRFAVSCTGPLLEAAGTLAQQSGTFVQTHLAETVAECELVRRLHGSDDYTSVYAAHGLLHERALLAHCVHLSDSEIAQLAAADAVAVHCPTANAFLRAGVMARHRLLDAGVRVALGSDIAGGYERSMVRVARAMVEATQYVDGPTISSAEAWWQITAGNADALGWPDAGRLEAGCPADLLVIEPTIDWSSQPDPLGLLMHAWDDRWLRAVYVEGARAFEAP